MKTWAVVLLVILAILIVAVVVLYFLGRKMQKKQEEQQQQIEAYKQNVTMLVIDKKIMKLKEAGLPQSVIDNTPKMMRRSKLPIVKAKVGPQIVTLVCDQKIFDLVPVKKEVKATVSGIYLTSVKAVRGTLVQPRIRKEELVQEKHRKTAGKSRRKACKINSLQFTRTFFVSRFHARMKICLQKGTEGAPLYEQK